MREKEGPGEEGHWSNLKMNGGRSDNAPITRAFVISCAIFTIVFGIQGRSNKLGFSYQFPEFIALFFSRLSLPSMGSTAPTRNVPSYAGRQAERALATLVSMGFDRSSARQALVHARNDINTATNILLGSC